MNVIALLASFGVGLFILYIRGVLLVVPLKWLLRLLLSSLIGFVLLVALNVIGGALFQFTLPLNIWNVLTAGVLGVPGVVLLVLLKLFL